MAHDVDMARHQGEDDPSPQGRRHAGSSPGIPGAGGPPEHGRTSPGNTREPPAGAPDLPDDGPEPPGDTRDIPDASEGARQAAGAPARSPEPDTPVTLGYAVFETAIGPCGLAWGPAGITGVNLPETSARETLARLAERFPEATASAAPPDIALAIDRIVDVLDGGRDDLADIALDLRGRSSFECRAYAVARAIPPGSTMTYGEVAAAIGNPGLARAVGRAMGGNPYPIIVPCHRVLGADGSIGGFSAHGGATTKRHMLLAEGVPEREGPALFGPAELYPTVRASSEAEVPSHRGSL